MLVSNSLHMETVLCPTATEAAPHNTLFCPVYILIFPVSFHMKYETEPN